jgi:hypothetical protein
MSKGVSQHRNPNNTATEVLDVPTGTVWLALLLYSAWNNTRDAAAIFNSVLRYGRRTSVMRHVVFFVTAPSILKVILYSTYLSLQ